MVARAAFHDRGKARSFGSKPADRMSRPLSLKRRRSRSRPSPRIHWLPHENAGDDRNDRWSALSAVAGAVGRLQSVTGLNNGQSLGNVDLRLEFQWCKNSARDKA